MGGFRARLLHIPDQESACRELRLISVDPAGVAIMAPKMLTRCLLVPGLQCHQANILKQEMLSLGGDAAVARGSVSCSIPSTDVILIGTHRQIQSLCSKLTTQPFGLRALAEELRSLLNRIGASPAVWRTSRRELPLSRPLIMGILNVTPDSFSDTRHHQDPRLAVDRALEMLAEGADIIDIGGESTRPGARAVPAGEELGRLLPVIEQLTSRSDCPISVDTWKSSVAAEAVAAGAEIINDISGFSFDPGMAGIAAASGAGVVLMHARGSLETMHRDVVHADVTGEVCRHLQSALERSDAAGVARACVALDPGIGFSKDLAGNLELLRRLPELSTFGLPLLVGTSRKSFIGRTLGREVDQRLYGTAATVALAVANGAAILRVHDVREMRDVADMAHAVASSRPQSELPAGGAVS